MGQQSNVPDKPSTGTPTQSQCDLTQKPTIQYNDMNKYLKGTDPAGNLYVLTDNIGSIADDGSDTTHFVFYKTYDALADYASTTYFAEKISFSTECNAVTIVQPEVGKGTAPTITVLNTDAVTKNTDANHEDVSADSVAEYTVTAKAQTDECSSKFGALILVEYDKTYVNKVESNLNSASYTTNYFTFTTNQSASGFDFDGKAVFMYNGELCDGTKTEFTIKTTQTSETPIEDSNNFNIVWVPLNKDINQDDLKTIILGAEDEDNNFIGIGNVTTMVYTA